MGDSGAADKNIYFLQPGDVVEPILYYNVLASDSYEFEAISVDAVTITEDTSFYETDLGDGLYMLSFLMSDYQNNMVSSALAPFEYIDGDIYTSVD